MKLSVFRFPLRVEFSFLFILIIFLQDTINKGQYELFIIKSFIIFLSILVHELGHAFAFRKFGVESSINIHCLGGTCISTNSRNLQHWQDAVISLAGPAAGFILALLSFVILKSNIDLTDQQTHIIQFALFINLFWGIFNLLPLLPMDGGQALKSFLHFLKVKRATAITLIISCSLIVVFSIWAIHSRHIWNLLIVGFFAHQNFKIWQNYTRNKDLKLIDELCKKWPVTHENTILEQLIKISAANKNEFVRKQAAYSSAFIFAFYGNFSRALNSYNLSTLKNQRMAKFFETACETNDLKSLCKEFLNESKIDSEILFFLRVILYNCGADECVKLLKDEYSDLKKFITIWLALAADMHYKKFYTQSIQLYLDIFEYKGDANSAYNLSCSYCLLKNKQESIKYLKAAIEKDSRYIENLIKDPDLITIRENPEIKALINEFI